MITILVNINKLTKNIQTISELCKNTGCTLIFCIKSLAGHQELLNRIFREGGLSVVVGDARESHFQNNFNLSYRNFNIH